MESSIFETFTLPSKGLVYDTPINPEITLRSMNTLDELLRCSPSETPYKVMCDIIEGCMKEKPAIHVYDMCIGDYQFLLHKIRIVTYGSDYKMSVTCPNCNDFVEVNANLDSLDIIEYNEEYENLKEITLPISNHFIELKYQTPRDLDTIERRNKEIQRKLKTSVDYKLIYTLMSLIKTVDGQVLNSIQLEEFVKKLPMKDVNYLINTADKLNKSIGIDNTVLAKCSHCGYEMVVPFRLTSEFFGPSIN